MNALYKIHDPLPSVVRVIISFLIGAAYFLCCLPSFQLIGHFTLQMLLTVILSVILTLSLLFFLPRSLTVLGRGLSFFLVDMLAWCLYAQIHAQILSGSFSGWIHIFFYDKPLTVAVAWGSSFGLILLLRLLLPFNESLKQFRTDYGFFFRQSSGVFLFFYVCVLVYCFLLQRRPGGEPGFNLIPFSMIAGYIQTFSFAYESIFYLIGNLLCFFPFGFYYLVYRRDVHLVKLILVPVVLSLLIEVSQLLFRMGDFDIDDILMNAFGFYAGCLLYVLIQKTRAKLTAGQESDIFGQE